MFSALQIGRDGSTIARKGRKVFTLPDVTIWTAPGQHHEVKHKNPIRGTFGLEEYRFRALVAFAGETKQSVLYTIHNHDLAGGRDMRLNNIDHWITADVARLRGRWVDRHDCPTWCNGARAVVPTLFWPVELWMPLEYYWDADLPF